jgi:hypothetical protein
MCPSDAAEMSSQLSRQNFQVKGWLATLLTHRLAAALTHLQQNKQRK